MSLMTHTYQNTALSDSSNRGVSMADQIRRNVRQPVKRRAECGPESSLVTV